ncbi:MAG: class II histone deacetylase [Rhodobacterales bacterium]|nr:class II histone deacetylase [Rhodobacterales bacterium]
MTTGFCFDELTLWHSTGEAALFLRPGGWIQPPAAGGHAESPETKRRFKNLLDVSGLSRHLAVETAPPASDEALRRIHPASYLNEFKRLSDAEGGMLGEESPFGPGGYGIAALSAGLAIHAMDRVLTGQWANAYSLSRPPGHHCMPDHSMGFCLLANIPIAIEEMRSRHHLAKVAVVDWDVHHGNGTQAIFWDRADVLTISLHQNSCYPVNSGATSERGAGPGEGANINVPLLPGGGHASYLAAMDRIVLPALQRFQPELIVVASGLDANALDPLARMLAHSETYRALTERLLHAAATLCQGRLMMAHEGGYSEAYVPFCGQAIMETLAGRRTRVIDPFLDFVMAQQPPPEFQALEDRRLAEMAAAYGL